MWKCPATMFHVYWFFFSQFVQNLSILDENKVLAAISSVLKGNLARCCPHPIFMRVQKDLVATGKTLLYETMLLFLMIED